MAFRWGFQWGKVITGGAMLLVGDLAVSQGGKPDGEVV